MAAAPSIHASAVLVGAKAILIRGPSGSGKSALAWRLIEAAGGGTLTFARLVADDRALVEARAGRLLVHAAPRLAGLIEIRGLGIRKMTFEKAAVVGLVADLSAPDAERMPAAKAETTVISGVSLPRLAVAPGVDAFPLVMAVLKTEGGTTPATD